MRRVPLVIAAFATSAVLTVAAQQQTPTFRTGSTLVPLNVRVVDRDGRPVPGLEADDFTIKENGVVQQIAHFSFETLKSRSADSSSLALRQPLGDRISQQEKRTFLFVFGRGRQVGPVRGVEGAMRFIRERLLPQDQVAILAYHRATNFTTDHQRVLATLERYWDKHEWIESRLTHHFSGLAAQYADPEIPPHIQKEIDAIFVDTGEAPLDRLSGTATIARDRRIDRDRLQQAELAQGRIDTGVGTTFDRTAAAQAEILDIGFEQYIEGTFDAASDLESLYAGVRYLRMMDGEKHLVLLTPQGLLLPRLENSDSSAGWRTTHG
jgi:VWFA-related protein